MNFGFYISGKSTRLSKFLKSVDTDVLVQIRAVISDYKIENELKKQLEMCKIPYFEYDYSYLKGKNNKEKNVLFSELMLTSLEGASIDYCFVLGSHILCGKLLEKYRNRLINFHPAILPMYPGLNSIDQAVAHGNTFLVGNTAHFIDEGVDTGLIIMQSVIPLQAFLYERDYDVVLDMQLEMLKQLVEIINKKRISIKNNCVIISDADYSSGSIFPRV